MISAFSITVLVLNDVSLSSSDGGQEEAEGDSVHIHGTQALSRIRSSSSATSSIVGLMSG
ncbi:hypothetical protein V6Z12_D03G020300 [Gossypium hirsutum]